MGSFSNLPLTNYVHGDVVTHYAQGSVVTCYAQGGGVINYAPYSVKVMGCAPCIVRGISVLTVYIFPLCAPCSSFSDIQ